MAFMTKFLLKFLILFLSFVWTIYSCSYKDINMEKDSVECRLYWVGDTYPQDSMEEEVCVRIISLHYLFINNTKHDVFLPIASSTNSEHSAFCSILKLYIKGKETETIFYPDYSGWKKGIIGPADSIHGELLIPERLLDSLNIDKYINLKELLDNIHIKYQICPFDSIFSKLPITDLIFTRNDTVAFFYADTPIKDISKGRSRSNRDRHAVTWEIAKMAKLIIEILVTS